MILATKIKVRYNAAYNYHKTREIYSMKIIIVGGEKQAAPWHVPCPVKTMM